jgi:single-stranded DNA-binding protein
MIKTFGDGRVAKDAKVFQYGKENKTGVSFGLICDRFYNDENPTYIQCTIWNRDEKTAQFITTGRQIFFEGKLTRNSDGYYNVDVDDFSFGQQPNRDGNSETRYQDDGERREYRDDPAGNQY